MTLNILMEHLTDKNEYTCIVNNIFVSQMPNTDGTEKILSFCPAYNKIHPEKLGDH